MFSPILKKLSFLLFNLPTPFVFSFTAKFNKHISKPPSPNEYYLKYSCKKKKIFLLKIGFGLPLSTQPFFVFPKMSNAKFNAFFSILIFPPLSVAFHLALLTIPSSNTLLFWLCSYILLGFLSHISFQLSSPIKKLCF